MTFPDIKLALVTGASSGLGLALARALAKKGVALLLTGRNEERLRSLAQELPTPSHYLALDLGLPADRQKLIAEIEKTSPDLIINNAGFGLYGDAIDHPLQDQINMIDVNITAVAEITLAAAKNWKNRHQKGIVLNVSSAASFFSYPTFAIYASSKLFVLNFSTSLDQELSPHGIRVLVVCPGQIDTGFRTRASNHFPQKTDPWTMSAEKSADLILEQIAKGQRSLIIDWRYRWAVALTRLIPNWILSRFLSRRILKRIDTLKRD
ncbi:MAG: SDR family NAD(P)-dependent oxidoreductase [Verrucomicrobia bacterium]|nr:SDR family NAD(P)-dependent oxidoreductase [Verrucomicrobiota bacterium]